MSGEVKATLVKFWNEAVIEFKVEGFGQTWGGCIKWDGCIDLDGDSMHFCSPRDAALVFGAIHKLAAEHIESYEGEGPDAE